MTRLYLGSPRREGRHRSPFSSVGFCFDVVFQIGIPELGKEAALYANAFGLWGRG